MMPCGSRSGTHRRAVAVAAFSAVRADRMTGCVLTPGVVETRSNTAIDDGDVFSASPAADPEFREPPCCGFAGRASYYLRLPPHTIGRHGLVRVRDDGASNVAVSAHLSPWLAAQPSFSGEALRCRALDAAAPARKSRTHMSPTPVARGIAAMVASRPHATPLVRSSAAGDRLGAAMSSVDRLRQDHAPNNARPSSRSAPFRSSEGGHGSFWAHRGQARNFTPSRIRHIVSLRQQRRISRTASGIRRAIRPQHSDGTIVTTAFI